MIEELSQVFIVIIFVGSVTYLGLILPRQNLANLCESYNYSPKGETLCVDKQGATYEATILVEMLIHEDEVLCDEYGYILKNRYGSFYSTSKHLGTCTNPDTGETLNGEVLRNKLNEWKEAKQ